MANDTSFFAELQRRNVYRVGIAYAVASWLLLQILDVVEPIIGMPAWVPRLILLLLAIGLPFALGFAWAYEMTPEGLKREEEVDRSASITHETGQRLNRIIIGVLVVAVGVLLIDRSMMNRGDPPETVAVTETSDEPAPAGEVTTTAAPSIAVLPFMNMSADESSTYFSDGLADTLLHMLAQIREIRVAARTSSFQFRDQNTDITKIAEALNVGTVLEGSVQRAGNKIRITAQLIEADTGYHLWSGNFDRSLDDIFAIQDEIASEVVAALKVSLLGESAEKLAQHDTDNVEAYTEYLLAINDSNIFSFESLRRAERRFLNAVELDPEFALAWARLANLYLTMQNTGIGGFMETAGKAQAAASRALELDPESSLAIAVLGDVERSFDNNEQAELLFQRAIELGPNEPLVRELYSDLLFVEGEVEESLRLLREALVVDPLSATILDQLHIRSRQTRDYDAAAEYLAKMRTANPESPLSWYREAEFKIMLGDWAAAIPLTEKAFVLDPDDPELATMIGDNYLALGQLDDAERWFERAVEVDATHPVSRAAPLKLYMVSGEQSREAKDLAWQLLEDGIGNRQGSRLHALQVVWRDALDNGELRQCLERLRDLFPNLFEKDGDWGTVGPWTRYFIGSMLIQDGQVEEGSRLIQPFLDTSAVLKPHTKYSVIRAWHLAAAQQREPLLEELRLLTEAGLAMNNWRWAIKLLPVFDFVRDESEFRNYISWLENNAIEQREELRKLRDTDNKKRGPT